MLREICNFPISRSLTIWLGNSRVSGKDSDIVIFTNLQFFSMKLDQAITSIANGPANLSLFNGKQ
jgi:hypothetical protein